jgi:hypothetical protein
VIGMGVVWGAEKVIGNSLSCGLWTECPTGATPGIHLEGRDGTGASPTIHLGRSKTNTTPQNGAQRNPLQPQNSGAQRTPAPRQQGLPQVGSNPRSEQNPQILQPQEPVEPQTPQQETVKPDSGQQRPREQSPSKGGTKVPSQQSAPSDVNQHSASSQ